MTQIDNGGPAFPTDNERQVASNAWHYEGMTLRDYFAAKALPVIVKDYAESAQKVGWDEGWQNGVAMDAYALADAMLRARGRHD